MKGTLATPSGRKRTTTAARDFTYEKYRELLEAGLANGYTVATVREYLRRKSLPERLIVVRHDVDRKPANALDMARIEADLGVRTTYYFRTVGETADPTVVSEIESLGHEVGYHYEDLDRTDGDMAAAHRSFEAELAGLRELADVDTVCMHGNPLTSHDNRDMWRDGHPDLDAYDLLGEAYLSMDFSDLTYFSDTGRTWRDGALKVKDVPPEGAEKQVQVDATDELVGLLADGEPERLYVLVHPNRWAENYVEFLTEAAKDTTINAGKRVLDLLRS